MENILKNINREPDDWVQLANIGDDAQIDDVVQTISCDTRDFAIIWNDKQPESYKKADCNYEVWTNEGLKKIESVKQSSDNDYLITQSEIFPWLNELCQKTGGYETQWRYFTSRVDGCRGWDMKYIRFVRHGDRFIVCNSYMVPVKWRLVADNIYDPMTEAKEGKVIEENDVEYHEDESDDSDLNKWDVLYKDDSSEELNWHTYVRPKFKVYYEGPMCGRCLKRYKENDWCSKHYQKKSCYRFKLEK